ncbi:uncharacterized protein LOC128681810 [Plodia interpunctella]|uniref:uncharacterized protein LOC128681810 n=1 Tax=Plodia interpunctella TaxID=58824 RepID=UPI0023675070|nr:uncharacterized protein LOC128681810 [Plodia interpunctella]
MAKCVLVFLLVATSCAVLCKPVDTMEKTDVSTDAHIIAKRFINPFLTSGGFDDTGLAGKMRMKRDAEECEKLKLCKLHARSSRNFLAAFELYFVNKENARLWDHRTHSIADCERRFSCYDR